MARLDPVVWEEIRRRWEFDPDEPTYLVAAARAAEKVKFRAPSKAAIDAQAKRHKWERRGSMSGINASAQRKADRLVNSDGSITKPVGNVDDVDGNVDDHVDTSTLKKIQASRDESEDKRAEVIARHRTEWQQVAVLRQEALMGRTADVTGSFNKAKLAKITAEMTMIQQVGERRAWGLDTFDGVDVTKLSDAQLEAIIKGKAA